MEQSPISVRHTPFPSVEAAWFWTIRTMRAVPIRAPDSRHRQVDDVIKCLDQLYRNRRIEMLHVRILRIWGVRGTAPNSARMRERSDWRLWHEAMECLEGPLRAKGIVAGSIFQDAAD